MEAIKLRAAKPRKLEFPLTPMLDVMFILLTVFIAVSEARHSVHDIDLPELAQETNEPVPVEPTELVPLLVQLTVDGRLFVADQPARTSELKDLVAAARAEHGDKLRVRMEADSSTEYEKVFAVMVALKQAGVEDVSLPYVTTGE